MDVTLDDLSTELDELRHAHRALAAQHLALQTVCRTVLPFIAYAPALKARLTAAYDATNAVLDEQGQDEAYQADVRRWLDTLSSELLLPGMTATGSAA